MNQTEIMVALAVGFSLVWGLSLWLLKVQITHVLTEVKRMPPPEWFEEMSSRVKALPGEQWFDEVHKLLKTTPDPARLKDHFDRVHRLGNDVNVLTLENVNLKAEVKELKERLQRDRDYLARVEERVARNAGRLDAIDRKGRANDE